MFQVFRAGIKVPGGYHAPMFQVFWSSGLILKFQAGTMFQYSRVPVPKFQSSFKAFGKKFPYLRHYLPCYALLPGRGQYPGHGNSGHLLYCIIAVLQTRPQPGPAAPSHIPHHRQAASSTTRYHNLTLVSCLLAALLVKR